MVPKFRVWDKTLKEWWTRGATLWEIFSYIQEDPLFSEVSWDTLKERLVFMQSTGRHDKLGVEVYQDDIVEDIWHNGLFLVVIDSEIAGAYMQLLRRIDNNKQPRLYIVDFKFIYASDIKVIGNVWENRKLINLKRIKESEVK